MYNFLTKVDKWGRIGEFIKRFHMPLDLVTFTEEIVNGKLHFLCSEYWYEMGLSTQVMLFISVLILKLLDTFLKDINM